MYQSSHVYQDCTNSVGPYQSSKTVKRQSKQQNDHCVPIVTGLPRLYQQCTKNDHWCTIVTGLPRLYQQCTNRQKQQKWPLVYQSSQVYQDCTNRVPIVKNSQTAKMTIGVPIVTCLHRVRRIHKVSVCRYTKPYVEPVLESVMMSMKVQMLSNPRRQSRLGLGLGVPYGGKDLWKRYIFNRAQEWKSERKEA